MAVNQTETQPQQTDNLKDLSALDAIGFVWKKNPFWTDRGIAVGGTGSGKSTLCENLVEHALWRYPELRCLIVDSKPRFRGQWETSGISAARRYRNWDHGTAIPDSYVLPLKGGDMGLSDVWRLKGRVAIAQTDVDDPEDVGQLKKMTDAVQSFLRAARASIPTLLFVDEVMDFFTVQGQSKTKSDAILRVYRAGRERGMGGLVATQRPRGIPTQLVQEANKLYLFKLRNERDVDHLEEFGTPEDMYDEVPTQNHIFYYFDHEEGSSTAGHFRLTGV